VSTKAVTSGVSPTPRPRVHLIRMSALFSGVAAGVLLGTGLFLATLWLLIKGGPNVGSHLRLLGQFLIGYDVTLAGSFVGLAYGFVIGMFAGMSLALSYNAVLDLRSRPAIFRS
jgi:hypothetical protein